MFHLTLTSLHILFFNFSFTINAGPLLVSRIGLVHSLLHITCDEKITRGAVGEKNIYINHWNHNHGIYIYKALWGLFCAGADPWGWSIIINSSESDIYPLSYVASSPVFTPTVHLMYIHLKWHSELSVLIYAKVALRVSSAHYQQLRGQQFKKGTSGFLDVWRLMS